MIKKLTFFLLITAGIVMASCKNDSEDDLIPDAPETQQDYSGIVLNEICGSSDNGDWIEVYNNSDKDVQLDGSVLVKTDEDGKTETIYTFPKDNTIKGKGYLIVYGKDSKNPQFTPGISNSKEVGIELKSPSGTSIDKFDRDQNVGKDEGHDNNGSYARIPNGDKNGKWVVVKKATPEAENQEEKDEPVTGADIKGVVLNEVCGDSQEGDWIELYNTTGKDLQLTGAQVLKTDEEGKTEKIYTFPEGKTIKAGGFFILYSDKKGGKDFTAGISNTKQLILQLLDASGVVADTFDRDQNVGKDKGHDADGSYARIPDGTGSWSITATATPDASNK